MAVNEGRHPIQHTYGISGDFQESLPALRPGCQPGRSVAAVQRSRGLQALVHCRDAIALKTLSIASQVNEHLQDSSSYVCVC
jgi:hypothetical protein